MRNVFFAAGLAFLVTACNQNTPSTQPVTTTTVAAPQTDSNATYVINDFLVDLAKTKSPYEVSKTAEYPLFGFSFTPTKLKGFTVHEGGYDADLRFDPAANKYIGQGIPGLEPFEFTVIASGDVVLTFLSSKKTYTYKKVPDVDSAVREILFAGKYIDPKMKPVIHFHADGTLTGLISEKTYQPVYDFMGGPLAFDEVIMREKSDESKMSYYHYKFKGDTLELYDAIQPKNGDGVEKIGKLRYTLFKE